MLSLHLAESSSELAVFYKNSTLASSSPSELGSEMVDTLLSYELNYNHMATFWQIYVLKDDETPLAVCGLYSMRTDIKDLWFGWLGVLPEHRCNGYGRLIAQSMIARAFSVGAENVLVYCDKSRTSFYQQLGFKLVTDEHAINRYMIDANGSEEFSSDTWNGDILEYDHLKVFAV